MKIITLKRFCMTDLGVYGVMIEQGVTPFPFCLTIELPWKDNRHNESCIPKGEYQCKRIFWEKHQEEVFQVMNVPNREGILIHKANFTTDILGCIGIGERFDEIINPKEGKVVTAITATGEAFNEFMKIRLANEQEFKLVLQEV